jgi:hypothetical protein
MVVNWQAATPETRMQATSMTTSMMRRSLKMLLQLMVWTKATRATWPVPHMWKSNRQWRRLVLTQALILLLLLPASPHLCAHASVCLRSLVIPQLLLQAAPPQLLRQQLGRSRRSSRTPAPPGRRHRQWMPVGGGTPQFSSPLVAAGALSPRPLLLVVAVAPALRSHNLCWGQQRRVQQQQQQQHPA